MIRAGFIAVLLGAVSSLFAQEVVSGKVTDGTYPIAYAKICLADAFPCVYSNSEGDFKITATIGSSVRVSSLGYTSGTFLMESQNQTYVLQEEILELEEVTIQTKSETEEIEESGFAVNAISMDEVKNQSIQVNEVLDQSVGVRVRQTGGLGSRVDYNLNGLTGNSIRIFIDGIPIENFGYSFSLSSIPTSLIERIEVYKGVVPGEFGTDALGGAINVITKKNAPNTLNTSYAYGSFNTHQWTVNGNYRDSLSGFTVKGSAFYNYSDNNYKVWGNQIYNTNEFGKIEYVERERFHDTYRSMGGKIDVGFTNVKWADQFYVGLIGSDMKKDIQHGATMESVYGNRNMMQKSLMLNTAYNKQDLLTKGLNVKFFASYSDLKRVVVDTVADIYDWDGNPVDFDGDGKAEEWASGAEAGSPSLSTQDEEKYVARLNVSYDFNANNTIGINQISTYFRRKPDDTYWVQRQRDLTDTRFLNKNTTGLYFNNVSFKDKLKTSVFVKSFIQDISLQDVQSVTGGGIEAFVFDKATKHTGYGVAFAYSIKDNFQLLTSAEKAVRLPTSTETFGNAAEAIDPAFDLEPEQSYNANLGFHVGPIFMKEHTLGFSANMFYRNTIGMIRQVVANDLAETFAFENQDKVLSKGVDMEVKYGYKKNIKVVLGSSIFNARFNKQFDEYGSQYIYYQDRLRNAPYFTFNGNVRYNKEGLFQKKSRFTCYYNLGYVHQFYRNWESIGNKGKNIVPTQIVHDLGVAYTFPSQKITLSADAKNILNRQVFDNWALQRPGRAFYMKLTYIIK